MDPWLMMSSPLFVAWEVGFFQTMQAENNAQLSALPQERKQELIRGLPKKAMGYYDAEAIAAALDKKSGIRELRAYSSSFYGPWVWSLLVLASRC
eukprot:6465609-Amphidinium_carterae.2